MTIRMSLPFILPSLLVFYALSEFLFYRFFSSIKHWRKTVRTQVMNVVLVGSLY